MRRRGFLKLLAGSATVVATSAKSGLLLESQRYSNSLLGFEFTKPEIWHYLSYQDYSDSGKDVLDDYDTYKALKESQGDPLVSVAQFYRSPPAVSPSISVFGEVPETPWAPEDVFQLDFDTFGEEIEGFLLEETGAPVLLGELVGARYTYSYDLFASASQYRMRTRCISVLHRKAVLSFNFISLDTSDANVLQALGSSEASIRLLGPHIA